MSFPASSLNEKFARTSVAALAQVCADWNYQDLADVMTAVSEAVTNAIIHAYLRKDGVVELEVNWYEEEAALEIVVRDHGVGIKDVGQAREPLFTTRPDLERSGLGFSIMESFMDELQVESSPGTGTSVRMVKHWHAT
jgi:stage II sporulation protein AB (anti-sigma F factor)